MWLKDNCDKKMSKHIETKHKLQELPSYADFYALIDSCIMSDEDRTILKMIYLKNKTLSYIADELGYSESTIKTRHKKLLKKLIKLL